MSFKFSTNFLLPYVRKPAKYGGRGSIGLDATPTVLIHICHPVVVAAIIFAILVPISQTYTEVCIASILINHYGSM